MGNEIVQYLGAMNLLEAGGLVFGLLAVWFLIKENIWTWPSGIIYVLISFVIFWEQRLYGDFILHIFFLILNLYGWYYWVFGKNHGQKQVRISTLSKNGLIRISALTAVGVFVFGYFLEHMHLIFRDIDPASVPYWDATTSVLSITGMWLTARKKIENWHFWFIVDVLATGIYIYKGIYFYAVLYLVYVGMAIAGYLAWRTSLISENPK